ncbi:MAG: GntR family transcriptional regulator [Rhodobacteraceae bacterium]|nr:GntR family transcriptional regulator [Paracoccaceae bacterium]
MALAQRPPGAGRHKAKRSDLIAEEVLRWALLNRMKPGDRLPQEKELLEMFECSRGTLREALKSLEVQGVVRIVTGPRGGARLTRVPEDRAMKLLTNYFWFRESDARTIYEARSLLEPLMVRVAIDHLTDDDFAAMRDTVDLCHHGCAGAVDAATHRAAEIQFHQIIANRVPNPFFRFFCIFVNHVLFTSITPKAVAIGQTRPFSDHVIHAHEEIIEALEARDADRASELMAAHVEEAGSLAADLEFNFDRALFDPILSQQIDVAGALERLQGHDPSRVVSPGLKDD